MPSIVLLTLSIAASTCAQLWKCLDISECQCVQRGNTAPVSGKIKLGEVGFRQTDAGHKESLIPTEQWVLRALACLLNVLYPLFQNRCGIYMGKP